MYKLKKVSSIVKSVTDLTCRTMSEMVKYDEKSIKQVFPTLDNTKHKGQSGRIGVIGGSREYTGAPYFAGISALRFGADLVHVFCTKDAGIPIKCYSPELIVHPILNDDDAISEMEIWFQRLHAIVIGPGLGRHPSVLKTVSDVIPTLINSMKPLIFDADGLHIITKTPHIVKGASNITLTPNQVEYTRLCDAINAGNEQDIFNYFGPGVTIVQKGSTDRIFNKSGSTTVTGGGLCRCGGQGDVLSGSIAVFTHWATSMGFENPSLFGAFCGCTVTKRLSKMAFDKLGRSMVAGDLIPAIPNVIKEIESQK